MLTPKAPQKQLLANRRDIVFGALPVFALGANGLSPSKAFGLQDADIPTHPTTSEGLWRSFRDKNWSDLDILPFNAANMAPPSNIVRRALAEATQSIDEDPSFENRAHYSEQHEKTRQDIADYLHVDTNEIAITRNTSEGNNIIVSGLSLKPTDEVVIWDQNHRSNLDAWQEMSKRKGFTLKLVSTPEHPKTENDLIAPFEAAMGKRVALLSFSHISNSSGQALPAQKLCALAKEFGALSMIDGAQTVGAMNLNLTEMGCDIYTASGQKWLCGPREAALLYIRNAAQPNVDPLIVSYPLSNESKGARRFEQLGQRDDAAITALGTAIELHNLIGPALIEKRIRFLTDQFINSLADHIPASSILTPLDPKFRLGVVVVKPSNQSATNIAKTLYNEAKLSVTGFPGDIGRLRICPHIYHDTQNIQYASESVMKQLTRVG